MNYSFNQDLIFPDIDFLKKFILIKNLKFDYYQSPLLNQNNFIHAFFTKDSSNIETVRLGNRLTNNSYSNFFIKQIHSNKICSVRELNNSKLIKADGLMSNHKKQNLWIYTADCMPILFGDRINKNVAAIHCGRKGLEKNIIPNVIYKLENMGSLRKDLLVAIGPSISGENYLIDKVTYDKFRENFKLRRYSIREDMRESNEFISNEKISLDIKRNAYLQLIGEGIKPNHIDVFNKCTFIEKEFHSWRRSKNKYRQWSIISSK